jgi:UDP-glucose 4-epimerase
MNILLTGGAGYIGSHICEQLVKNKINNIYILDNLSTGHRRLINKKAYFIKGDIKNFPLIRKIIIKYKIQTIIHLAASLNVSEAENNKRKYYQNNIKGTKNLILSCKNSNIKNFIFSSSSSIYGNTKGGVDENKKPNPKMFYAYTKYEGEKLVKKYSKKFKYNYAILRYFNVAGASESGQIGDIEISHGHLIKNIAIEALKKKTEINIYGNNYPTKDGTCIRDYIHVSDLADIHLKSFNYLNLHNKSVILNCGYGKGYSVKQIVNIFKKIKKNLIINYKPKRPGDVAQMYSNTKKLKQTFKWKAKFNNINLIIKSAIKWEKKLSTLK